jgi:hypothetical protein
MKDKGNLQGKVYFTVFFTVLALHMTFLLLA